MTTNYQRGVAMALKAAGLVKTASDPELEALLAAMEAGHGGGAAASHFGFPGSNSFAGLRRAANTVHNVGKGAVGAIAGGGMGRAVAREDHKNMGGSLGLLGGVGGAFGGAALAGKLTGNNPGARIFGGLTGALAAGAAGGGLTHVMPRDAVFNPPSRMERLKQLLAGR